MRKKYINFILTINIFAALFLVFESCNKNDNESPEIKKQIPLEIISIIPIDGDNNVSISQEIRVSFSEDIDESSVDNSIFELNCQNGQINCSLKIEENTIIFTHQGLDYDENYDIKINPLIKDIYGNYLSSTYNSTFATELTPLTSKTQLIGHWVVNDKFYFDVTSDLKIRNFKTRIPTPGSCFGQNSAVSFEKAEITIDDNFEFSTHYSHSVYLTSWNGNVLGKFVSPNRVEGTYSGSISNICTNSGSGGWFGLKEEN